MIFVLQLILLLIGLWGFFGFLYFIGIIILEFVFNIPFRWSENQAKDNLIHHLLSGPCYWQLRGCVDGFMKYEDHVKGKKKLKMRTTTIHLSDRAKKGVCIGRQQIKDGKFRMRQP